MKEYTYKQLRDQYLWVLSSLYPEPELLSVFYMLLDHYGGMNRASFSISLKGQPAPDLLSSMLSALERLQEDEPVQYIIGEAAFCQLTLKVTPAVLIPRPETEELVDWVVRNVQKIPRHMGLRMLDIGTGSGCIALALKSYLPDTFADAVDISEEALAIAAENARKCGIEVNFRHLDILEESQWDTMDMYDIIVSNPPYIPDSEYANIANRVRNYEPAKALFVTHSNPLLFYSKIAAFATTHLNPSGKLYFEINQDFETELMKILNEFHFIEVISRNDLSGKARMVRCSS